MKNKNLLFRVIVVLFCALSGGMGSLQASNYDESCDGAKRRRLNTPTSEQEDDFLAKTQMDLTVTQGYFPLLELLPELLRHVFSFVDPSDLVNSRHVCRALKEIASADVFEYQIRLHYGIFTSYLMFPERYASLIFSKDGESWENQKLALRNGAFVSSVEKCRLTKYNKHHYAAIFLRNGDQSGVQILSCKNGIWWTVVTSKEGVTLNDLQWVSFRKQLWLAFISSDTFELNFVHPEDLNNERKTNFNNVKSYSLTEFKDQLYLAYTTLGSSEIYVASSGDGITWDIYQTPCHTLKNVQLISYQNKLRLIYATLKRSNIDICSSEDGKAWSLDCPYTTFNNPEDLEVQIFRNDLTVLYTCQGASTSRLIIRSGDGKEWGDVSMFYLPQKMSTPKKGRLIRTK